MRLIDADALSRAIKIECNPYSKPTIEFESGKKVLKIIANAPTIEPFEKIGAICNENCGGYRPKGKWLSHYEYCGKHGCNPSALIAFWWCDQCEQAVEQPTNFCPNCGADMRGEA